MQPPGALAAATDKLAQRHLLARVGVLQPDFAVVGSNARSAVARLLPAVVKPVDRTASQGVLRADTRDELDAAEMRVRRLVGATAPVLVERFVPGVDIALDALLHRGSMQVRAVVDKPETPTGPTFPETLLISPA